MSESGHAIKDLSSVRSGILSQS